MPGELPQGRLTAEELALGRELHPGLARLLSSPTPMAVSLLDDRILLVGDAFLRLTGYGRDEVLGVSGSQLIHPRMRVEVVEHRARVLEAARAADAKIAETYHRTLVLVTKAGEEVDVRCSRMLVRRRGGAALVSVTRLVPVKGADKPPEYWAGRLGGRDAQVLIEALTDAPGLEDLEEPTTLTSGDGVLLRVNRAFSAAFGWDNREVVGLPAAELVSPELRGWAEQRLAEITGAPLLPRASTTRVRHRDGRAIEVETASVPVRDATGETRYVVATVLPRTAATSLRSRP